MNAGRHPHLRQAVLDRTLHAFTCGVCSQVLVIEKDLLYVDFDNKQFFCVYLRNDRAREAACSDQVKTAFTRWMSTDAPEFIAAYGKEFLVRVCFGYEELREKIVIDAAGLSDLVVEAVKIDVMRADAWFREAGVATLRLDHVTETGDLAMRPEWYLPPSPDHARRVVSVKRAVYQEVDDRFDEILRVHPELARGAHVSLLRLVPWPELPAAP